MTRFVPTFVAVLLMSVFIAVPALAQIPPAPTALPPSNITSSAFQANWDSTGYGQYHIAGFEYRIDVSTNATFSDPPANWVVNNRVSNPPYNNITGITPFVTYYYRVRAVNASGTSPNSNIVAAPIAVPTTATGATNISATGFTAHWVATPGVTGYKLDIAKLASFGPVVHTTVWDSAVGNVTSFTVAGLTPDTTYFYRVRTVSGAGESENSNYVAVSRIKSASPLASGTINVPYSVTLQFDGTATPVSWAISGGSLPAGLSISTDPNTGNGLISGTPTALGTSNFTAQVTDNTPATATKSFSINIVSTPTIAFDAVVGYKYLYTTGAEDNGPTITWDHTIGPGSNRMLIVQVGATAHTLGHIVATGVTYNGKALTLAKEVDASGYQPGADYISVGQWYMLQKDLPDSGSYPVVATFAGLTTGQAGGSISLNYVKQAAPEATVGDSGVVNHLTGFITTLTNHAWLVNAAVNGYSGSFFLGPNQEVRYQIDNGNFDIIGDTKEVATAGPASMEANHHIEYRMAQVVIAVAPVASVTANARVKFFLQGPYVTAGDTMSKGLKTGGQLVSHFGSIPIPVGAVDSVNIEIRDSLSAAASTKRAFAPAWVLTDGTIRDFVDTTKTYVGFGGVPAGKYYVVVRHRNHIAIMSSVRDSVDGTVTPAVYDFSTGQGQAFGTNAMISTGTRFSLIAGNATSVDQVINSSDRVATRNNLGANDYNLADVTLDGVVNSSDRVTTRNNLGQSSQVP